MWGEILIKFNYVHYLYLSIYLPILSNPCMGPINMIQATWILVKLTIKKGRCNQYTMTKENNKKEYRLGLKIKVWWDLNNLADWLVELLQCGAGHSFELEFVPLEYSSWKNVIISRSSYQPVGQGVLMSRWSYKWD